MNLNLNNATQEVVVKIVTGSNPNADVMITEYVDGSDNVVGAMVLSTEKVNEKTEDWRTSFWMVVMMASRALMIPSCLQASEEKYELLSESLVNIYSSKELFFAHYQTLVTELAEVERFKTYCAEQNVSPQNVAQHLIYEGGVAFATVKEYGAESFYGSLIKKFDEPIFTFN